MNVRVLPYSTQFYEVPRTVPGRVSQGWMFPLSASPVPHPETHASKTCHWGSVPPRQVGSCWYAWRDPQTPLRRKKDQGPKPLQPARVPARPRASPLPRLSGLWPRLLGAAKEEPSVQAAPLGSVQSGRCRHPPKSLSRVS